MIRRYGSYGRVGPAVGFTWSEVRCSDGSLPSERTMRRRFVAQARYLNVLRNYIAKCENAKAVSIQVNSWYRSGRYNAKIGGARFSQHVAGRATDIQVTVVTRDGKRRRLTPKAVGLYAAHVRWFRLGGIGVYDSRHGNFTHVDHRAGGPARWYNKG